MRLLRHADDVGENFPRTVQFEDCVAAVLVGHVVAVGRVEFAIRIFQTSPSHVSGFCLRTLLFRAALKFAGFAATLIVPAMRVFLS